MRAMTKKEWMAYIEKTWDAAQKEAWSDPEFECPRCGHCCKTDLARVGEVGVWGESQAEGEEHMNRTTCPYGMVDTCCENYNDCSLKDAEIKRQNEKIEFLARTNMLYSDWEHRNNQVTSDLIRKGIEEAKINAELRAEIERLKQREWVGLTDDEIMEPWPFENRISFARWVESKVREKNT